MRQGMEISNLTDFSLLCKSPKDCVFPQISRRLLHRSMNSSSNWVMRWNVQNCAMHSTSPFFKCRGTTGWFETGHSSTTRPQSMPAMVPMEFYLGLCVEWVPWHHFEMLRINSSGNGSTWRMSVRLALLFQQDWIRRRVQFHLWYEQLDKETTTCCCS